MRIAIFGGTGRLGSELVEEFSADEVTPVGSGDCDVADYEAVMSTVFALGPDVIVNCAAITSVDLCETNSDRAFAVNALGARNVALGARALGAHVVHMSVDYVFDGELGRPYDEWDAPAPISVYGRSKLGGENGVLELCPGSAVVRSGPLLSVRPPNFALAILDAAQREGPLQVVGDNVGSPTYVPHLVAGLARLVRTRRGGIFHIAGGGECSRAELARELLGQTGNDPDRVRLVSADAMKAEYPAARPRNAALDGRAWRLSGFEPLPSWQQGVSDLLAALGQPAARVPIGTAHSDEADRGPDVATDAARAGEGEWAEAEL